MKTEPQNVPPETSTNSNSPNRLPLQGWALELARRWNGGTYSLFVLHGNIFDLFPVQNNGRLDYVPLKTFLVRRLFPQRSCLLFYDISDGLTFGSPDMQKRFFEWLEVYDSVENTNFHEAGPPRDFNRLASLLRRFFLRVAEEKEKWSGITLIIDFPEKLIPATEEANASVDERMNLVTFLKWAAAPEMAKLDIGVILVTESAAELNARLLQNPYVAQVRIDLPDADERLRFLSSGWGEAMADGKPFADWCDFTPEDLAARTAGLNLLRIRHFLAEAIRNSTRVTQDHVTTGKKRLIEEYCQGLVRFKDPKPGVSLDRVATHTAAKQRLRELAWLIKNGKTDVLERGILVPGRVGVGKSFIIDCFASECGLPVMEMGEFRSKWVGDTERQQARILMTIRALGPVIVVVDEADAVFGTREADGDSGVSGRVFAAFAAHIGDSTLRGRELWVAMTSRPDLLSIDMKRQGRFGLCMPLFPAQNSTDVIELFSTVAKVKGISLNDAILTYIRENLGEQPLTGSDVESILIRAKEKAVLAKRDSDVQRADLEEAVSSFIDPLDPDLLALQELAAVLACSDRRYLPERYRAGDRAALLEQFAHLKLRAGRR
ncbi:MAG TPA: ATP-binding protein [Candidatus Limnocylindrales bacterium]|jgi:AAA+ superfamily predicted ATPase|nr:ATP-binding protein [Candidatus Limnocylindrales bacterium]